MERLHFDIGGATAEVYGDDCETEPCLKPSCLYPNQCGAFSPGERYWNFCGNNQKKYQESKKIFLGSGIRYDVLLHNPELLEEILLHHSGRFLRIAPEHTEDPVLNLMRKPSFETLESFVRLFNSINRKLKRKIELAPYLIVGHPGEKRAHVVEMKKKLASLSMKSTDAQIFTPTPGTLSTAMYYAECDLSFKPIPVEKTIVRIDGTKEALDRLKGSFPILPSWGI